MLREKIRSNKFENDKMKNEFISICNRIKANIEIQPVLLPKEKSVDLIHELFVKTASSYPDAIAVVVRETEHYTYKYVDQLSNKLANYLLKLNLQSESIIAVCLDKDINLIITLIAILKIGAVYLPLDPQYTLNRLSFMLENSEATILITQDKYKDIFNTYKIHIIDIDNCCCENYNKNLTINKEIFNDSLAYVIYTSGSTGKPKGIMNTHDSIVNCFKYFNKVMPITPNDVYIQQASISFDTSIEEIFRSLMTGAKVVFTTTDEYYDIYKLINLIEKQNATVVQFVPNKLVQFVEHLDLNMCQTLLQVYCGGEPLNRDVCENFYRKLKAKLFNVYGPSESYYTNIYEVPKI